MTYDYFYMNPFNISCLKHPSPWIIYYTLWKIYASVFLSIHSTLLSGHLHIYKIFGKYKKSLKKSNINVGHIFRSSHSPDHGHLWSDVRYSSYGSPLLIPFSYLSFLFPLRYVTDLDRLHKSPLIITSNKIYLVEKKLKFQIYFFVSDLVNDRFMAIFQACEWHNPKACELKYWQCHSLL